VAIVGRTTPWTFTESTQVARPRSGSTKRSVARASYRRKTRRIVHLPFSSRKKDNDGLGSNDRRREPSARAARPHERATGVSEARSHEATSVKTRGLGVRSGGSGRRRRETSCPSIHCAPGLIPRGREVGREPRARVQVGRLVGWQKSVGRIAICIGRSSPKETPRTLTRARGGGRVNRCAKLRTEHSRSARSRPRQALALCVSEHDRRRLGSSQYVPFTGFIRRGLGPVGFSKLRDGWGRSCGACRATSRRQRWDRSR
jgi:hypothetical protein